MNMQFLLTGILVFANSSAGWGQVQAGRIVGNVLDPSGSPISGAQVTVTNQATNDARQTRSDGSGGFAVTPLEPGNYRVEGAAPGFQPVVKTGVELQVGQSVRLDLELPIGQVATKLEVRAEVPLIDTESGTLGQVVTNRQIVDLPLNGRGFWELARLATGVLLLPATGSPVNRIRPNNLSGIAIGGVRGGQTAFLVDGMFVSDNLGGTAVQISVDALQEFKVQQNAYSAEYPGAGGLLNVTTKSGTNKLHGSVFEFLRNDKLDARNFFALDREILKRSQFGATVGGPLTVPGLWSGKDRTFFLFSYEGMRERQGLVFGTLVPAAAMLRGDFTASGLPPIYDPLTTAPGVAGASATRGPFPGNRIPADRLSPQTAFYNRYIPAANAPGGLATDAPSRAIDEDQYNIRIDQILSDRHRLFGRWSYFPNRSRDPNAYASLGTALLKSQGRNLAVVLNNTLTPTLIHEFRFSALPAILDFRPFLDGADFNRDAGILGFEETRVGGATGSFPDFSWSGYTAMNGSAFDQRPKTQDRDQYDFMDTVTWIRGRHIVKTGGFFRKFTSLFTDGREYAGRWSFTGINTENPRTPAGTGHPFADWALGFPAQGERSFATDTFGGYANYWSVFLQDDWNVSSRLTLNLGLRYEYSPWLKGYRGQLGTFDPTRARPLIVASGTDRIDLGAQQAAAAAYPLYADLLQTSSQAGLPLSITYTDKRQWAPRFGFAFRTWSGSVVRGGYGVFYDSEFSPARVNITIVPFKLNEVAFNDRGALPRRTMRDFFLGQPIGSSSATPTIDPTYVRMRMGYNQHWNFGIQQALPSRQVLEIDYAANRGAFLSATNDFNLPPAAAGNVQARRPFPRFGRSSYRSADAASIYHSLQVKIEKRLSTGLWYLGSYTLSKIIDHRPAPAVGGNYGWERALVNFDVPHNFALSAGYTLPFGTGRRLLNNGRLVRALATGWQVQGILGLRSGRPFTPTVSRDTANIGVGGQRPNRTRSGALENPTVAKWFDTAAFAVPPQYTYGNSGANILREDSFESLDCSLFRTFALGERVQLQARAEFFNVTNTPSFGPPNVVVDTQAGGRVTATSITPRQAQFALKLYF